MISERIYDDIPPPPPNGNFEYRYPHSNVLLQSRLKLESFKLHKATQRRTSFNKNDVICDVKLFPTVYRRIYCRKFLTLSNQTSRYKSKCIRMALNSNPLYTEPKL